MPFDHITPAETSLHLRALPYGAAGFALGKGFAMERFSKSYNNKVVDIRGTMQAGQHGSLIDVSRGALEGGIAAFIAAHGYYETSWLGLFDTLERAVGPGSPLVECAWELECANPDTPEEAKAYAEACVTFVEQDLGMRYPKVFYGYNSEEERREYLAYRADLHKLLDHLGLESPFVPTRLFRSVAPSSNGAPGTREA